MKNGSFEIESDCLDITERLKEIDKDYFVVYNTRSKAFELHNHAQIKNTYCLTFPYPTLDERALELTRKTRVENSEALFLEMERENRRLQEGRVKEILDDFKEKLYES